MRELACQLFSYLPSTFRGRGTLISVLTKLLLRKEENLAQIGEIDFPFLKRHWPFYLGVYEPETTELLKKYLGPGDTFFDVGANVGYFSAIALNEVGSTGQVFAFEPEEGHFARLKKLSQLNLGHGLNIFNCAISNTVGSATLFVSNHAGWHSLNDKFNPETRLGIQTVETITLDEFCIVQQLNRLNAIKFIKIDVEGFEDKVLLGAKNMLAEKWVELIFIEVTPEKFSVVKKVIDNSGYRLHRYNSRSKTWKLSGDNFIVNQENFVAKIDG